MFINSGFSTNDFLKMMERIDSHPTVFLIKTTNDSIFGGFCSNPTQKSNKNVPVDQAVSAISSFFEKENEKDGFVEDGLAFLFSLFNSTQPNREPQRFLCKKPENAFKLMNYHVISPSLVSFFVTAVNPPLPIFSFGENDLSFVFLFFAFFLWGIY